MRHMIFWALSLICGVAYVVSVALGDSLSGLGMASFLLMVVAVVTDRGTEPRDSASSG